MRNALASGAVAGALHNRAALVNPNSRAQIASTAATAGWRNGNVGRGGWWRHRNGGYGWVGPLFWPFAYYDIYDYTLWGYGYDDPFWDYGYTDIYAGLFSPYGYDDLVGYLPDNGGARTTVGRSTVGRAADARAESTDRRPQSSDQLAPLCGDDSRDIAGLPIDRIQQELQLDDAQRAALDDLANASAKSAQEIRAACPTQIASTAPGRLAAMQTRIEAMIAGVNMVQPPLQKFYNLLSDEQKSQLNALGKEQRNTEASNKNGSLAQSCGAQQSNVTAWPASEIESRVHPTEAQRASFAALQDASAKAADMLKDSCPTTEPITPPARLEAIANRLNTMLQAVKTVRAALDDLYGKLSDEQKAQFEAIGPQRSAASDRPAVIEKHAHARRRHASIPGLVRHIMSMARW